jgi:serine/threonine protein kinase
MAAPQGSFAKRFSSLKISGVQATGKKLGKGADATVQEVDWFGTSCAAKQLHEVLLEDDSPGGAERFIDNFAKECTTWSRLIHPHVVQFLGVCFFEGSRVPSLILEKMDTSLRMFVETHAKEDFLLEDKVYVLRQIAQGLSYLHSRNPPLVHHDLSPNNVLLNEVSFHTKLSDFGMTRALDLSKMTRKSSVKGTLAFMGPEALHSPPKYDEKLDMFSYGNVMITTVTHKWPEPGPPNRYKGDKLVALTELQRREHYLALFDQKENELFLQLVHSCLKNRPAQRPTSIQLVKEMRKIEESHPRVLRETEIIAQLQQERDELQREKDRLSRVERQLCEEKEQLAKEKQQEGENLCKEKNGLVKEFTVKEKAFHLAIYQKEEQLRQVEAHHQYELEQLQHQLKVLQGGNVPPKKPWGGMLQYCGACLLHEIGLWIWYLVSWTS